MSQPAPDPSYSAKDITVLEGLEPVRLRPGMYIGSTGLRGLHHLVYEVVDNAVDEAMAGYNDSIEVTIHPDNSVTVVDHGRGIPVDVVERTGQLGADGRPDEAPRRRQVRRRGLQGLRRPARRRRLGRERALGMARRHGRARREGVPAGVCARRPAGRDEADRHHARRPGTTISFLPDAEIFEELEFSAQTLVQRLRETAFLTRGLRIAITDERAGGETRRVPLRGRHQGLRRVHQRRRRTRSTGTSPTSRTRPTPARSRSRCSGTPRIRSRCSRSRTTSTRSRAAPTCRASASALTRTLNKYARDKGLLKEKEDNLEGEDVREGLAAVISVKLQNPQFEGQTKSKLGNPCDRRASSSRPSTRSCRSSSRRTRPTRARS